MNSQQVKAEFSRNAMNVRVRDFGYKFRICGVTMEIRELVESVAAGFGLTDSSGKLGGQWNGKAEFIAYKPGAALQAQGGVALSRIVA